VIAAFFSANKAREREEARLRVREQIEQGGVGWQDRLKPPVAALRGNTPPVVPFHWPLEFPEVFGRHNPGFDAIVGNPPFAGKNTIIKSNGALYIDWLKFIHEGSHGNADLVAHFFRRAFTLLREKGAFGLIATKTIAQGDTRLSGLTWICGNHGTLFNVRKRFKWPGQSAVIASMVHGMKGAFSGVRYINRTPVPKITAFLLASGTDDDPKPLASNEGKSFVGSQPYGMGFTFDDTDKTGVGSPLSESQNLSMPIQKIQKEFFPLSDMKKSQAAPSTYLTDL